MLVWPTAVGQVGEHGIGRGGRIPDSPQRPDDTEETLESNSMESQPKFSSGSVYTRWGKSSCPDVNGTELVYILWKSCRKSIWNRLHVLAG